MDAGSHGGLLFSNGTVLTERGPLRADVRVVGETISEVGTSLAPREGERVVDAQGKWLLPGAVDPHVHLSDADPGGTVFADDFESGSAAALAGGVTTFANMTFARDPETLLATLERDHPKVRSQAIADVVLHPVFDPTREIALEELQELRRRGVSTIKLFTVIPTFDAAGPRLVRLFEAARDAGLLILVHCEDFKLLAEASRRLAEEGRWSLRDFPDSRPIESEVRAVEVVAGLCEKTGAPTYIVHLSSRRALEVCRAVRSRGAPLYVESRPIYLKLTRSSYERDDGALFVAQPPLREQADVEALWEGLGDGSIDTMGSDHVGWTRADKLASDHDLRNLRPGVPDLEYMVPLLYTEGVRKGRLTLQQLVDLTAHHPARLLGLYPQKGTVAVGSDADLVLWDFDVRRLIDGTQGHSRAGFSVYDGQELYGVPALTVRRGQVVFEGGRLRAAPGTGQLLRCHSSQPPARPLSVGGARGGRNTVTAAR